MINRNKILLAGLIICSSLLENGDKRIIFKKKFVNCKIYCDWYFFFWKKRTRILKIKMRLIYLVIKL
jgi:hypothetical protein